MYSIRRFFESPKSANYLKKKDKHTQEILILKEMRRGGSAEIKFKVK